jgi:hypothetical protein
METLSPPYLVSITATTGATIAAHSLAIAAVPVVVAMATLVVAPVAAAAALAPLKTLSGDVSWTGRYGCFTLRCALPFWQYDF